MRMTTVFPLNDPNLFRPADTLSGFLLTTFGVAGYWYIHIFMIMFTILAIHYFWKDIKKDYKNWRCKPKFYILPISSLPIKDRSFIQMVSYTTKQRCGHCGKEVTPDVFRCSIINGNHELFFCNTKCKDVFKSQQR